MNITTKGIIKLLPFEEVVKKELLEKFDGYPEEKKFQIERVIWDTFSGLYESTYQKNLAIAFENAQNNNESLDGEFNKRVLEKTRKELEEQMMRESDQQDLASVREAMEKIIREMKASGMSVDG